MLILWIILIVLLVYYLHKSLTRNFDYFSKRGIPNEKPNFFFGSSGSLFRGAESIPDYVKKIRKKFVQEKY